MVRKLNFDDLEYPEDCKRICEVACYYGYIISPQEAGDIWAKESDMVAAGWLCLPDTDKDLWQCIRGYLEKDEDPEEWDEGDDDEDSEY